MIADEATHRMLAYIDAVNIAGGVLAETELEGYAVSPDRLRPTYRDAYSLTSYLGADDSYRKVMVQGSGETAVRYLTRVGWISVTGKTGVRLTLLGKNVLRALDRPTVDVDSDDPITVVVNPEDPFAHVRIFEVISGSTNGLLVDPYLDSAALRDILGFPKITRIMTGTRKKDQHELMRFALGAVDTPPEIRLVGQSELHDRFFIPDAGHVLSFGSSLNSIRKRPGVVVPVQDRAAASAIRSAYEAFWVAGSPLQPKSAEGI